MQTLQPQKNQYQPSIVEVSLNEERSGFWAALQDVCQQFLASLTTVPEVRVWKTVSDRNVILWHVYDPCTKTVKNCTSEHEAKAWLEEFYGIE